MIKASMTVFALFFSTLTFAGQGKVWVTVEGTHVDGTGMKDENLAISFLVKRVGVFQPPSVVLDQKERIYLCHHLPTAVKNAILEIMRSAMQSRKILYVDWYTADKKSCINGVEENREDHSVNGMSVETRVAPYQ